MRKQISTSEMKFFFPVMSDHNRQKYEENLKNFETFKEFWPTAEILHTVESGYEFSTIYTDSSHKISVSYNWSQKNKWVFCLSGLSALPMHDYYTTQRAEKIVNESGVKEPQLIGVLTEKKISNWVNYYTLVRNEIDKILQEKEKAILDFKESIKDFTAENGYKVTFHPKKEYNDSERGYFEKNGIQFFYEIQSNGFINQKLNLVGGYSDNYVKSFKGLSDNKFRK